MLRGEPWDQRTLAHQRAVAEVVFTPTLTPVGWSLRKGEPQNQLVSFVEIVQLCPYVRHSPSNPTDVKVFKLTVTLNSPPVRFARFALGGYELGG